jgi:hypothetical protein
MTYLLLMAALLAQGEVGHETMTGSLDGDHLTVRMDTSGIACRGYLAEGHGRLVCSDGRTGAFLYQRQDDGTGTGYGRLGSEDLILTFG